MKRPILVPLLLSLSLSLSAQTPWAAADFSPLATRTEGGMILDRVRDGKGVEIEIAHRAPLEGGDLTRIKQMQEIFAGFKIIKPRVVSYVVDGQKVEASYLPETLPWQGLDMRDNLPAGLAFQFTGNVQYDFRLVQTNVFVRIQGLFEGEESLLKKIREAVDNPILYIKRNDPNYFSTRLGQIEDALKAGSLSNETLLKRNEGLALEVDLARRAALAYIAGGLFGPKVVDGKVIDAVVAARKADPTLTAKAITEKITKEGLKATDREVAAIIQLWWNVFEK